jgi:hypothetical protein
MKVDRQQRLKYTLYRRAKAIRILGLLVNILWGIFALTVLCGIVGATEEKWFHRQNNLLSILCLIGFFTSTLGIIFSSGVLYFALIQPVLKRLAKELQASDFMLLGPIALLLKEAFAFPTATPGVPPEFLTRWTSLMLQVQSPQQVVLTKEEKEAMEFFLVKMELYRGYRAAQHRQEGFETAEVVFQNAIALSLLHALSILGDNETRICFRDYMLRTSDKRLQELALESLRALEQRLGVHSSLEPTEPLA